MRHPPDPQEPVDEPLEALLAAVARADRGAYARLYARTSAKLFGVVLRIVKDRGMAEEVLQEVFLGIWRGASSYAAEKARPMTWMITIARNRAIDAVRVRREVLLDPGEDGEDPFAAIPDPFDAAASFADRDALTRCLDRLEETQRHCILLAYCEGWSREELAARTGKNVNTIKTWLHRGLAALRGCLSS
ncbi:sigma-70 family RNA polymerase sigma factor [Salinarimonas chemoclinalis]|uniref:sigma-70 family RNA polymerase sigma factor n=1 Tax=Salinarimonas chemoclinalis TaxID=3241599 RepID=UPI0035566AA3